MKQILKQENFELYAERRVSGEVISVSIYSVWPQARTDRSPHKLFNINLSKKDMDKLGDAIKGV